MTDPKDPDQNTPEADWAEAMAEQAEKDSASEDEAWAASLEEQAVANEVPSEPSKNAGEQVFKPLDQGVENGPPRDLEMILDIPVKFTVELGRTRVTIKQLLELTQGSVVELDGLAGEPMDILINGYLIAQGEVVVVDDRYGIRITDIITPSERVQKLDR